MGNILGTAVSRATRGSSLAQIGYVAAVAPSGAPDLVASVYAQVERDFGMLAPPVVLHAAAPDLLAACWSMLRETLLATGSAGRSAKEAVAAAVSLGNACPYCVEVHTAMLHGLVHGQDAVAIGDDRIGSIADPVVRQTAAWARASGIRAEAARHEMPFPAEQIPELVGVAVTFQYLNRMVNVFLTETVIPPRVPPAMRRGLQSMIGRLMRPATRGFCPPGAALSLLPEAVLPADLSWAAGNPTIAGAFARAAAAVDAAAGRSVPEGVRNLLGNKLAAWDGQAQGPSRAWTRDALSGLPEAQRSAGQLALLTALASYQVDQSVIDEFQAHHPGDQALIELTSWASLAAARRVGSWMQGQRADAVTNT
jgi:AhpD family alkylhydroperoxidase